MVQRNPRLPEHLLVGLGIQGSYHDSPVEVKIDRSTASTSSKLPKRSKPKARKEERKAARQQRKDKAVPLRISKQSLSQNVGQANRAPLHSRASPVASEVGKSVQPKSVLKRTESKTKTVTHNGNNTALPSTQPPSHRLSKGVRDRLADDDAEIAALEKALGLKGTKKLPKSFEDDGLDVLLGSLDQASAAAEGSAGRKRKREGEEWLRMKRLKAVEPVYEASEDEEYLEDDDATHSAVPEDQLEYSGIASGPSSDEGGALGNLAEGTSLLRPQHRVRENPYVAPMTLTDSSAQTKYVPPPKRDPGKGSGEDTARLKRQMQGLLNRFSEANLLSVVKEFEGLYRMHPRQDVTTTLIDLLVGLLCDPTALQDTFVILHAGFIAALYKIVGSELGAQLVLRVYDEFTGMYKLSTQEETTGKKLSNLTSLLAQLYNFKVVGSGLIYDLVRLLIEELSERNAEMLLRIVRNSGPQLRKDDPASLKAISQLLHTGVAQASPGTLSVRTNFMVETIDSLANKSMKTGKVESLINAEHISRMSNTLGSLNERNIKASEPLNINLKDLRESDRRGKWWVVGASYRDDNQLQESDVAIRGLAQGSEETSPTQASGSEEVDVQQLARQLGLNTDIRRSIFMTLMAGDDFETACDKLRRLPLNKSQRSEIPRVLVRCSGAEVQYNPYYTLIARRIISREPKLKREFQYALWNVFEKLRRENAEYEEPGYTANGAGTELNGLVNHAKMFGALIAEAGLPISVLKDLSFAYLEDKLQHMAEVLLITVMLGSEEWVETGRNEKAVMDIFLKSKEAPDMVQGLRYFLKQVVSRTDIAGSREKQATVRWGCKVARDALKAVSTATVND